MAIICSAPQTLPWADERPKVFLAGSIERPQDASWQHWLSTQLLEKECILLNPDRLDWSNERARLQAQIAWEQEGLLGADLVLFYFSPQNLSPISLLELGLMADKQKAVVCCPVDYVHRAYVEAVCRRWNLPLVEDLEALLEALQVWLLGQDATK